MIENIMKRLYDASGYCNTGHVSRVMEGSKEALKALLLDDQAANSLEPPPQISADEFYDLHKMDLEKVAATVVNQSKEDLRKIEADIAGQTGESDATQRRAYKERATAYVQERFTLAMVVFLRADHAALVANRVIPLPLD